MSAVLLLRLAGPMQSWGTRSRFSHRDTGTEPSKSGVVGLLCAALGWPREANAFPVAGREHTLADLGGLPMAVRADREGRLMRDYHTAQQVRRAGGGVQDTVLSERYYLADAGFLVGLAGDRPLLDALAAAVRRPVWPLALGRKAFVPSAPVCVGVCAGDLLDVLKNRPWRKRYRLDAPPTGGALRYVVEVEYGAGEPRPDVPVSFASRDRRFAVRHVATEFHPVPAVLEPAQEEPPCS